MKLTMINDESSIVAMYHIIAATTTFIFHDQGPLIINDVMFSDDWK